MSRIAHVVRQLQEERDYLQREVERLDAAIDAF
jgi:prefoldin subunit 5